jgi:hypothetical protein
MGEVWGRYIEDRRPHGSDRHHADHLEMVEPGGRARTNRPGVKTIPGPLAPLLPLRLVDLMPAAVEAWAAREAKDRPARVWLALRLLKAFLRWADGEADLKGKADPGAAGTKRAREVAGKAKPKNDVLQREQLPALFRYVRQIQNPVIAAYLQCLLLTGARREELAALPRRNEWVFSSLEAVDGHIVEPSIQHRKACAAAGLDLLRVHHDRIEAWMLEQAGIEQPSASEEQARLRAVQ